MVKLVGVEDSRRWSQLVVKSVSGKIGQWLSQSMVVKSVSGEVSQWWSQSVVKSVDGEVSRWWSQSVVRSVSDEDSILLKLESHIFQRVSIFCFDFKHFLIIKKNPLVIFYMFGPLIRQI